MAKQATTIDRQIEILKSRGLSISDENKAKEILLDIGYYRLGFYLFPFEKTYPQLRNRTHEYIPTASFEDAVALYYFDFDLRLILMRYLNRIELSLRSFIINYVSVAHQASCTWFIDPAVVESAFAQSFDEKIYSKLKTKVPVLRRHHAVYLNDRFAPAWKTLEYVTLGSVIKIYEKLRHGSDKTAVCRHFGVRQSGVFRNYLETILSIRNCCAHGNILYDYSLPMAVGDGPAGHFGDKKSKLFAAISVIRYIIGNISINRGLQMDREIKEVYRQLYSAAPHIRPMITAITGFDPCPIP